MELAVNVYGRNADAPGLVYRLLARFPRATVAVEGDLSVVTTELHPEGGGPAATATVHVRATPFAGPDGDRQRQGMAAFLRDQLDGPEAHRARALVPDLAVAVAILVDEAVLADPDLEEVVLETAALVAGWCDGFVLSMAHGDVRGPDGEVWGTLPHGGGAPAAPGPDPSATVGPTPPVAPTAPPPAPPPAESGDIPASLIDAAAQAGDLGAGVVLVDLPEDLDTGPDVAVEPPPLDRVVARLLVLVAVSARALTEEDGRHLEEAREGIDAWCGALGIGGEVEEHERALLRAEPGTIDRQALVDGSWGAEAAAVLAWALGLLDLPAPDEPVAPGALYDAVGFPRSADTIAVLAGVALRSPEELAARHGLLVAIHWRLRQLGLDGAPLDLAAFARTAWFGPLEVDPATLAADGDLSVGGRTLVAAEPEAVRLATSIALERHRAIGWLLVGGRYSDTDVST